MIAVIPGEDGKPPCVIFVTGRHGFKVKAKAYCGRDADASDGVYQVPDDTEICPGCKKKIAEK